MSAFGTALIASIPESLSGVKNHYPRFEALSLAVTRENAQISYSFDAESSYSTDSTIVIYLEYSGLAAKNSGTPSCSLKGTDKVERADKCTLSADGDAVSFNLKSTITQGSTYAVTVSNIANNDWETCGARVV